MKRRPAKKQAIQCKQHIMCLNKEQNSQNNLSFWNILNIFIFKIQGQIYEKIGMITICHEQAEGPTVTLDIKLIIVF